MTSAERRQQIALYGDAGRLLTEALDGFPRPMWQFRPAPDRWTIHEIVVHIADSEANSYIRCRKFIAEPGSTVLGYDEMGWATALHYHAQSADDALALFRHLRHHTYTLIRTLDEAVWARGGYHTEAGPMTLDDWLAVYARHIPDHIAQMQAVYADWQAQEAARR
jgi:DinB family protein